LPAESCKGQRRLREKAKKMLHLTGVIHMTPELLAEQDPQEEVIGWLQTIRQLADPGNPA
jgi:hypothetical protein